MSPTKNSLYVQTVNIILPNDGLYIIFCIFAIEISKRLYMSKKYRNIENEPDMASEPFLTPEQHITHHEGGYRCYTQEEKDSSTRERVMASTVSVDEYFDELISLVHEDYANLCL